MEPSPSALETILQSLAGTPLVIVWLVIVFLIVAWILSWIFLPWFILSRLKKIHLTILEIRDLRVNSSATEKNPFQL